MDKNIDRFIDYSEVIDISLEIVLDAKHYQNIIEMLLTGAWNSKKYKKRIRKLFERYRPQELAEEIFELVVMKKIKTEDILLEIEKRNQVS